MDVKLTCVSKDIRVLPSIQCLVCEDPIELTEQEEKYTLSGKTLYKICPKCKEAILYARELKSKELV